MVEHAVRRLGGLVALVALLVASRAEADARVVAVLTYDAASAPGCPDERHFRDVVAGRLGYDPFVSLSEMRVDVTIHDEGERLHAEVLTLDRGVGGARDLEAPTGTCEDLVDTIAAAVAIVIDPLGLGALPAEPGSAPPPAEPEPAMPDNLPDSPPATDEPPPVAAPVDPWRWRIAAHLHGAAGRLPGAALGGTLAAELRYEWASMLVEVVGEGAIDGRGEGDLGIDAWMAGGTVGACAHADLFVGCTTVRVAALGFSARDPAITGLALGLYAGVEGRAGVEVPLGAGWSFLAQAELSVPFTVAEVKVEGSVVWRASPVAGGGRIGIVTEIP